MTPIDEVCAEFERLENQLVHYTRPDPRTKHLHEECADILERSFVELVSFLTATQIAQLEFAYWNFMDRTCDTEPDEITGMFDGAHLEDICQELMHSGLEDICQELMHSGLEDICQELMHSGHQLIRHPETYPVPQTEK